MPCALATLLLVSLQGVEDMTARIPRYNVVQALEVSGQAIGLLRLVLRSGTVWTSGLHHFGGLP